MDYEFFLVLICFAIGVLVYKMVLRHFWKSTMFEGLENQQASPGDLGLAEVLVLI